MIGNLKILGLALAAAFAFSAVAASGALAQGKLTSDGPVTLTGTETGPELANSLTFFGNQMTCPGSTYTGHKVLTQAETATKKHELLPSGSTAVTVTPHYKNCLWLASGLKFPVTIDMNGCDFELDLKGTTTHEGIANVYKVKATEECPEPQTIQMTVFANAAEHAGGKPFCVIDITKKTDRGEGLVARDTANGTIDITGTITNIVAHRDSPTGSILCTKKTDEQAILHIDVNVKGHNSVGGATAISLSD